MQPSPTAHARTPNRICPLLVWLMGDGAAWSLLSPLEPQVREGMVAATVGDSFRLVLPTPGASLAVKLGPGSNGLRVSGNEIVGTPARPMVMFAALDHDVGVALPDTIWIAVFAAGLPEPVMPDEPYGTSGRQLAAGKTGPHDGDTYSHPMAADS